MGIFNKPNNTESSPFRRADTVMLKEVVDENTVTLENGNTQTIIRTQEVYKGFIITDSLIEEKRPDGSIVSRKHLKLGKSLTTSAEKVFRKLERTSNSVYALESEKQVNQLLLSYTGKDSVEGAEYE